MDPIGEQIDVMTRRHFFGRTGVGLGTAALAGRKRTAGRHDGNRGPERAHSCRGEDAAGVFRKILQQATAAAVTAAANPSKKAISRLNTALPPAQQPNDTICNLWMQSLVWRPLQR